MKVSRKVVVIIFLKEKMIYETIILIANFSSRKFMYLEIVEGMSLKLRVGQAV